MRLCFVALLLAGCGADAGLHHDKQPATDGDSGVRGDAVSGSEDAGVATGEDAGASVPRGSRLPDGGPATNPDQPGMQLTPTTLHNYAFVTSLAYGADFGGLSGADALCDARAKSAGLPGIYKAWLSTKTENARDRIPTDAGGWARPDRLPFAASRASLLAGAVLYPPRITEMGDDLLGDPFPLTTATGPDGTFYANGTYSDCAGWTSIDSSQNYRSGSAAGGTFQWTAADGATCEQYGRLLCLGVDDAATVIITAHTGRLAFLSSETFAPGGGVARADALCQREADDHARPGVFQALLAVEGASAASRFTAGEPWLRADGVAIALDTENLLAGGPLLAPITLQLDGSYHGTTGVWTGADSIAKAPVTAAHCASWTNTMGEGRYGISGQSDAQAIVSADLPCDSSYLHLYCLEY